MLGWRYGLGIATGAFMYADLPSAFALSVLIRHLTRVIEQLTSNIAMATRSIDLSNRVFSNIPADGNC